MDRGRGKRHLVPDYIKYDQLNGEEGNILASDSHAQDALQAHRRLSEKN
jgi:hypothetical protein